MQAYNLFQKRGPLTTLISYRAGCTCSPSSQKPAAVVPSCMPCMQVLELGSACNFCHKQACPCAHRISQAACHQGRLDQLAPSLGHCHCCNCEGQSVKLSVQACTRENRWLHMLSSGWYGCALCARGCLCSTQLQVVEIYASVTE